MFLPGMLGIGVRKTIRKARQLIYRLSYKVLFLFRRGRIKKFDERLDSREAYVTIDLHKAGFTDQLIQFTVFYSIGKSLGCQYYFTELDSNRSKSVIDEKENAPYKSIYDFLGCHSYLRKLSVEKPSFKNEPVTLDLDDSFFNERGLIQKKLLTSYLKLKLYPFIKTQDTIHIKIGLKGHSSFFGTYNMLEGCRDAKLDFRHGFESKHKQTPWTPRYKQSAHSMVVHIRQGDTAIIQTPWNTFINAWSGFGIDNSMIEFDTLEEARTYRHIVVDEYHTFLSLLSKHLNDQFFPVQIFSDGYKRAFRDLLKSNESFGWTQEEIDRLRTSAETYDQKEFGIFDNDEAFELTIGEGEQKLYDFIYALLHADVVVIGTQQRMVPKFLSVYCTPENVPLVIVLYNKFVPSRFGLGRSELLKNYLLVDINDYDISTIASQVKEFALSREKQD